MRLAKSQAHQPFPGFLGPGFFLSNHRCKSLFQSVCPDSNRAFSLFGQMHSASALFERRFSRLAAVFFSKNSQRLGRRFVGPDGLRKRRPFSISKRALAAASETAGRRRPLRPHFFTTGGSLTWTTKTQVVSSATSKKSVFLCTVQDLEPCQWRESSCLSFGTAHPSAASPARAACSIAGRMRTRPRQRMPCFASRTSPRRRWSI